MGGDNAKIFEKIDDQNYVVIFRDESKMKATIIDPELSNLKTGDVVFVSPPEEVQGPAIIRFQGWSKFMTADQKESVLALPCKN